MSNKIIVLLVEGHTEVEFYKKIVDNIKTISKKQLSCKFTFVDIHGIGNYTKDTLKNFNRIKVKNPTNDIFVYLCIDTDAFEFSKKPPINKENIKKQLENAGAKKVMYIEAKHSIEDWFLYDFQGVLKYLRLPSTTKKPSSKGQDALKSLFKKANKVYVKGSRVRGFVDNLDISLIMGKCCKSLKCLCDEIDVDCNSICGKHITKNN